MQLSSSGQGQENMTPKHSETLKKHPSTPATPTRSNRPQLTSPFPRVHGPNSQSVLSLACNLIPSLEPGQHETRSAPHAFNTFHSTASPANNRGQEAAERDICYLLPFAAFVAERHELLICHRATHKLELCFRTLVPQAEEFGKYALNVCRLVLQIVMGSYTVLITSPESHSQHLLCRARPILGFQCLGEANALVGANLLPKRLDNCLLVLRCVELGKFLALLQDIGRWEMR